MRKLTPAQVTTTAFGILLLAATGSTAATAEKVVDGGSVDVTVDVADRFPSGILALSVAVDSAALTEVDSGDPMVREFTGILPEVTVTDTRSEVPGAPWYVLGTASDFTSGSDTITADHLGWSPTLTYDYGPEVQPGGDVSSVADDPGSKGLAYADGELLYVNYDQIATYDQGSWSASAGLQLKVDAKDVAAGRYTSVLTLSLFE